MDRLKNLKRWPLPILCAVILNLAVGRLAACRICIAEGGWLTCSDYLEVTVFIFILTIPACIVASAVLWWNHY